MGQEVTLLPDNDTVGLSGQTIYFFHGDLVDFVVHLRLDSWSQARDVASNVTPAHGPTPFNASG